MNKRLRNIALNRLRMIEVVPGNPATDTGRASFIAELAQLGCSVSNSIDYNDSVLGNFNETVEVIRAMRGGDVEYVPLFSGFPDEVPEKDEFFISRIFGYLENFAGAFDDDVTVTVESGFQIPYWLFDLNQFGADPILGRQDQDLFLAAAQEQRARIGDDHIEWIGLEFASTEEIENALISWVSDCFYAKSSIKASLRNDLEYCMEQFGVEYLDPSKVVFKETRTYLVNHFWNRAAFAKAGEFLDTPTDALRLMAAQTDSDISLAENVTFPKLNRAQRRVVLNVIENSSNAVEDLDRYRGLWLALGRGLHPGEYQSKYPKAYAAFQTLRNEKILSFNSLVDGLLSSGDITGTVKQLSKRPSVFGRKLHHLLESAGNSWQTVLSSFAGVADQIPVKNLMVLQSYFNTIETSDYRTIINKKGNIRVMDNRKGRISTECNLATINVINEAILRATSQLESWKGKRVFINDEIRNYTVPLSQRHASDGLLTIGRGSRISINMDAVVRLFIYWKESWRRTDYDLSCVTYDENMNYSGHISYTNLSNSSIVHSGDITSAPYGASEFIDIPVAEIRKADPKVRYIAAQTYVYSGERFTEVEKCYAGWMVRKKTSKDRNTFDIKTVQNKVEVRGSGKYTIPCLLDLVEGKIIYTDMYMKGIRSTNRVEGAVEDISTVTKEIARMYYTRPNMLDLAMANTIGRGAEIVMNPEDADITFGVENSTYNVTDLEKILNELL